MIDGTPQFASAPPALPSLRAAVLCPGPSMVQTFAGKTRRYAIVIGVNRAVCAYACDYWVMLDDHTWDLAHENGRAPIGTPTVMCDASLWRKVQNRARPAAERHNLIVPADVKVPMRPVKWHTWSATAAVALAHHLGARSIDVFGMDWEGVQDFDGFTHQRNSRTDERWRREQACYLDLQNLLAESGSTVTRVRPEGSPVRFAGTKAKSAEVPA